MIYLVPIILFLIPLVVKLYKNFKKWKAVEPVNHNKEWFAVALSEMTTSGVFFFVLSSFPDDLDLVWVILLVAWKIFVIGCMIGSWFLFLFDASYNLLRLYWAKKCSWFLHKGQYSFWYTGSDDKDDAVTDNILQRLPLWAHISLKLSLVIGFTYLYIYA